MWLLRTHAWQPGETFFVALTLVGVLGAASTQYVDIVHETQRFRSLGLTEAGTSMDAPPPVPPALVEAARTVLKPEDSWTLVTDRGTCREFKYGYFWVAYQLLPNLADCEDPDVQLRLREPPPPSADVIAEGERFWVVRR